MVWSDCDLAVLFIYFNHHGTSTWLTVSQKAMGLQVHQVACPSVRQHAYFSCVLSGVLCTGTEIREEPTKTYRLTASLEIVCPWKKSECWWACCYAFKPGCTQFRVRFKYFHCVFLKLMKERKNCGFTYCWNRMLETAVSHSVTLPPLIFPFLSSLYSPSITHPVSHPPVLKGNTSNLRSHLQKVWEQRGKKIVQTL